jgi:hypothetical protein
MEQAKRRLHDMIPIEENIYNTEENIDNKGEVPIDSKLIIVNSLRVIIIKS